MSAIHAELTLTARAARVLAEICAANVPVTLVGIGTSSVIQGRVSFAHGGRAAVVSETAIESFAEGVSRVVLTAYWQHRVVALSGAVRDVNGQKVSLDLSGDLRGNDPRQHARTRLAHALPISVSVGEHTLSARVRDVSAHGLALLVDQRLPPPDVGAAVEVSLGAGMTGVDARVCHRARGMDDEGMLRIGLALATALDPLWFHPPDEERTADPASG